MRQRVLAALLLATFALAVGNLLVHRTPAPNSSAVPASPLQNANAASGKPIGSSAALDEEPARTRTTAKKAITPMPAPGAPLAQIFDELKARADAGDVEAASRLLRDLHLCKDVAELQRQLPEMTSYIEDHPNDEKPSPGELSAKQMLESSERILRFIRRNAATCDGLDQKQSIAITPIALKAAQLGDRDARICYLFTMSGNEPGLLDHPEWLTQYKQNAPFLIESATEEGDWRIVAILRATYAGMTYGLFGQMLGGENRALAYRYLELQRLGATGGRAADLDKKIAQEQMQLSASQIADAHEWAQQAYSRYFAGTLDESGKGLQACRGSDEP